MVSTAAHGTKKLDTERLQGWTLPVPPAKLQHVFSHRLSDLMSIQLLQQRAQELAAEAQRLATGTTTLAIECARQGLDWEVVQDQRLAEELREMQRRKELGLPEAKNQPTKPEPPPEPEDE